MPTKSRSDDLGLTPDEYQGPRPDDRPETPREQGWIYEPDDYDFDRYQADPDEWREHEHDAD